MNTKDIAYSIINKLSEGQLKGFIAMFSEFYSISDDKFTEKEKAFEELEKLRRPIPDIDEKTELNNWRAEKYSIV